MEPQLDDNNDREERNWKHRRFRIRSFSVIPFAFSFLALQEGLPWGFLVLFGFSIWLFVSADHPEFFYRPLKRLSDVSKLTVTSDIASAYLATLAMAITYLGIVGGIVSWLFG